MHIPKHYFHDRAVLIILGSNTLLVVFTVLYILLKLDPSIGSTPIIQVRSNLGIGAYKSGSVNEIRLIALFAALQYAFSWILSVRLYVHRRQLSLVILALTTFILILTPVVSDALFRVN